MPINKRKFTLTLGVLASFLLSSLMSVQVANAQAHDWSAINTVTPGTKLVVKLKTGKAINGKLRSVTDSELSLSVEEKTVNIKREDVLSVHQNGKQSATKATLIGMAVGAGAGAALGAVGDSNSEGFEKIDHAATAGLTVVGAGAGALVGYLIGRSGRKRVLIYAAR